MPLSHVQSLCTKKATPQHTVQDQLAKSLMCLSGVSCGKALAISSLYPSPAALRAAFEMKGRLLLAKLKYGEEEKRAIGPRISTALFHLYSAE